MLELNTLYNADCMDALPQFPNGYFDMAIVDPPYGVGAITYMPGRREGAVGGFVDTYNVVVATMDMNNRPRMKTNVAHKRCAKETPRHFGDENVAPGPEYFAELFRVSKNQIIFGGNYFLLPPSRGFVIWDKGRSEKFSMAMAEYIWLSFNVNAKIWKGQSEHAATGEPRVHPTQKPVKLYEWLLTNYAKSGDKILDTHAGSASSLIACHNMGLEYIGYEIDGTYYALAQKRLDAAKGQLSLYLGGAPHEEN